MSLRGLCDQLATERACNDDVANRDTRSGFAVNLEAGEYSLLVDGFEVGGAGTSTIRIRPPLPPAACIDDNNEAPAAATPLGVLGIDPIELRGASLCPMVDPSDFYGFQLETGGLVFADVRPTEPLTGGTVFGAFFRGNAGIGGAVQSDAAFNVRAYVATGGDYAFAVQGNAFNGPYGYDVDLYHSPSITCEAAQRPGCIACTDAFDPNDNINQARPIVLNGDYANLFVCGADFDFYSVQLAANREVRIDVDINAMLGDFALSLTDGRDAAPLQMSIDGLRYTFRWTPAVAGRYYVNIRPNPGEVSYRLRVSQ